MNNAKLSITDFGSENHSADLVLLCPHDNDGEEFLEDYAEIAEACGATRGTLEEYIALERDRGSGELSHAIAEIFTHKTNGDYRTSIVVDNLPRGLVDTNRIGRVAIRDIVERRTKNEVLMRRMQEEHDAIMLAKEKVMQPLAYNRGLFLDIHTMAPYNRPNDISIKPGEENIRAYINSYLEAKRQGGTRRNIDLITDATPLSGVGNPELTAALKKHLTGAGIPWDENLPYTVPMAYGILSSYNMLKYAGLAIDVPKDSLAKHDKDGNINLLKLQTDRGKVLDIAAPIARATIACLRERRA